MQARFFEAGTLLFRQGDAIHESSAIHIITNGTVKVLVDTEYHVQTVAARCAGGEVPASVVPRTSEECCLCALTLLVHCCWCPQAAKSAACASTLPSVPVLLCGVAAPALRVAPGRAWVRKLPLQNTLACTDDQVHVLQTSQSHV